MESHSAAKSQPMGPFPTVATSANELASRKARKMNGLTRRAFLTTVLALELGGALGSLDRVFGAGGPVKVRLGTLAPRGSSYYKHLQAMGEKWRQAPGGGVLLTMYPDGTMGTEADMVRRMRLGQLQAGMLTAVGLAEIESAVTGPQNPPMMFRSLEEGGCRLGEVLVQRACDPARRSAESQAVRVGRQRRRHRHLPLGRLQSRLAGGGGHPAQPADRPDQCGPLAAEHRLGRPGRWCGAPHARSSLGTAGRGNGDHQEDLGCYPPGGAGSPAPCGHGDRQVHQGRRPARKR